MSHHSFNRPPQRQGNRKNTYDFEKAQQMLDEWEAHGLLHTGCYRATVELIQDRMRIILRNVHDLYDMDNTDASMQQSDLPSEFSLTIRKERLPKEDQELHAQIQDRFQEIHESVDGILYAIFARKKDLPRGFWSWVRSMPLRVRLWWSKGKAEDIDEDAKFAKENLSRQLYLSVLGQRHVTEERVHTLFEHLQEQLSHIRERIRRLGCLFA